jgi:hypothetical protein
MRLQRRAEHEYRFTAFFLFVFFHRPVFLLPRTPDDGKFQNPVTLCAIHHRQNPIRTRIIVNFRDVTPCSLTEFYLLLGEAYFSIFIVEEKSKRAGRKALKM